MKRDALGFGLIGIILVIGIISLLAGGSFYAAREGRKSVLQQGIETERKAQELVDRINKAQTARNKEIDGNSEASKIDTSTWKIYRNEKYGFEVKYPPLFRLEEHSLTDAGGLVSIGGFGNDVFAINVLPLQQNFQNISQWADAQQWPFPDSWRNHFELTSVNDLEALHDVVTCGYTLFSRRFIFLLENGVGFARCQVDEAVFNNFISSFRLSEQIDTSTWKTYRNEKYGFEFKYPREALSFSSTERGQPLHSK